MPIFSSKTIKKNAALGTAAVVLIAAPFIKNFEGRSLRAYLDVGGIATICDGETYGIKLGDIKTHAECEAMTQARVAQFARQVDDAVDAPMTPQQHAAFTSFAYNVGVDAFRRSSIPAKLNAGRVADACATLMQYVYAGYLPSGARRDCRVRANGCYGIVYRREAEFNLCMKGY